MKHNKKNIMIFSPTPSHPQSAGNRARIYLMGRYLQELGHKVHFVYYTQEGLNDNQLASMEAQWDSLVVIKKYKKYTKSSENYYNIDDWYQDDIGPEVAELCRIKKIDILFVNYIFQSKLLEFIPDYILKVIDTHDRFSDRHIMLEKNNIKPDFFYTVSTEESKAFQRADVILAIQDNETAFFKTLTSKSVITVGHFEKKKFLDRKYSTLKKIGFIGSANSVNLKSLLEFLEQFLLMSNDKSIKIELYVAGSICSKIDVNHEAVKILDFVDDLHDFYQDMDLIINPLILGTGLKIKTIEALSYGVPIVSTLIGFEGIKTDSMYHQAKSTEELIERIKYLCRHEEELEELASRSKKIFVSYIHNVYNAIDKVLNASTTLQMVEVKNKSDEMLENELMIYKTCIKDILELATFMHMEKKISAHCKLFDTYHQHKHIFYYAPENENKYIQLLECRNRIKDVCEINVWNNPFKKIQKYREMLGVIKKILD